MSKVIRSHADTTFLLHQPQIGFGKHAAPQRSYGYASFAWYLPNSNLGIVSLKKGASA
jgi:hypothetical protein